MTGAVRFTREGEKRKRQGGIPSRVKARWERTFVRSVDARKPGNSIVEYTRNGPP
jgi:hypothetical protein